MAGEIKGITIKFQGETTSLEQALKKVDASTRSIDKELSKVNKGLKFSPTSVELWRQKQELLTTKISETEDRLQALKDAQAKLDGDKNVDKTSDEYRELQREIVTTESKLKTFKGQLVKIGNYKLKALSEQFKNVSSKLQDVGDKFKGVSKVAAGVLGAMGTAAYKAGEAADELNTMSTIYGISTEELQKYKKASELLDVSVEDIAKSHQKLGKNMYNAKNGSKTMAKAFKDLGIEVTNADGSFRDTDDVWQETIEKLGGMKDATKRNAIAMQLMGKSASNLNPLIEDNGETYKNVSETLKKYDLDYIDQDTLDKANEFNDSLDTIKIIGTTTFEAIGTKIATALQPHLEKVVDWVGKFAEWLNSIDPNTLAIVGVISGILAVVTPLFYILSKVFGVVSFIIGAISSFIGAIAGAIAFVTNMGGVLATLSAAFQVVVAAIGGFIASIGIVPIIIAGVVAAIIAIGVALWKNWDKIKAKAIEIKDKVVKTFTDFKKGIDDQIKMLKLAIGMRWAMIKKDITDKVNAIKTKVTSVFTTLKTKVSDIWSKIKSAMTKPIQSAKTAIANVIEKIKSLFNFNFKWPHIDLPHFSVSPKGWKAGDLLKGKIPTLGISWYDQGGIFDRPSVIGVGEKRPEFVGALDDLRKIVREESGTGDSITINVYGGNQSATEIAKEVEKKLIEMQNRRRLAWR